MADVTALEVLLYGVPVGTLTRVQGDRTLFTFHDDYIQDENRAVLGLGFKDQFGQLITEFPSYQTRVMPFFSNLLPEGRMRTYLARLAGVDSKREFFLLWALGGDLSGAITIRSAEGDDWPLQTDEGEHDGREHHARALRFSLAGVQLKFSALGEMRSGLSIPAKGIGGSWIIKLPSLEFEGVPENEYSMMTLARLLGMDVPALDLVDIDAIDNLPEGLGRLKGQALVIERFDRLPDGRGEHIEDFAQVFGVYPEAKYNKGSTRSIARVIGAEGTLNDIGEFIRRLTFNTLIGNGDMHLKNWSLIYPDQRRAALAPAYDFVSTIAYLPYDQAALKVSRTKRFDEFTEDELSHLAAKARLPERLVLDTARETVALFHQYWQAEKNHLPLTQDVIDAIDSHIKKIPMV
ncbi:MAG: type II toxin-antitoxin system HipA family toxin [Proteobacteria bacterium]|nr:type II toxin-antitoxin system HipA family toxin [Pseudomonadota bacterium]